MYGRVGERDVNAGLCHGNAPGVKATSVSWRLAPGAERGTYSSEARGRSDRREVG